MRVGGVEVGGRELVVIAGPCSVETEEQMREAARGVGAAGARLLRGGAFKPRTSPYAFQGLGEEGLRLLAEAGRDAGLPTVTEVVAAEDVPLVVTNRPLDGVSTVLAESAPATGHAVEHLHALGHRRLVYLAGPGGYSNSRRIVGLRAACARLGLDPAVEARVLAG